jgi:hypothetical protein
MSRRMYRKVDRKGTSLKTKQCESGRVEYDGDEEDVYAELPRMLSVMR